MTQPSSGNWGPPPNQGGGYGPPNQGYGPPQGQWGPPPPPKQKHTARNVILGIVGAIVLIAIISGIASSSSSSKNGTSTPAAPDSSSSSSAPAKAKAKSTPAGTVLLSVSGSGAKQTQKFTTGSDDWDLAYTYNCSSFGGEGNFVVDVYGNDGSPSFSNTGVNDLGPGKSDVTHYHNGGTYYLDINSECSWTVKATTA